MSEAPARDSRLAAIEHSTIDRYTKRLVQYGTDPRSLGWGDRDQQRIRFEVLAREVDLSGRSVLDFGCGFGDLLGFLQERDLPVGSYTGIDVNEALLDRARDLHPDVAFHRHEMGADLPAQLTAEVVVMLGLMNFRQTQMPNEFYAQQLLQRAWDACGETLVCDFISACRAEGYPHEDWIHYYDPGEVLCWGLALSPRARLIHDYPPIPQREMLLVLQR